MDIKEYPFAFPLVEEIEIEICSEPHEIMLSYFTVDMSKDSRYFLTGKKIDLESRQLIIHIVEENIERDKEHLIEFNDFKTLRATYSFDSTFRMIGGVLLCLN